MTAAEYQAQHGRKGTATATKRPRPANPPPAPTSSPVAQEKPTFPQTLLQPQTHLIGPYAVQVGGRLHAEQLPDRLRVVVTGPADAAAVAGVLQVLRGLCET